MKDRQIPIAAHGLLERACCCGAVNVDVNIGLRLSLHCSATDTSLRLRVLPPAPRYYGPPIGDPASLVSAAGGVTTGTTMSPLEAHGSTVH